MDGLGEAGSGLRRTWRESTSIWERSLWKPGSPPAAFANMALWVVGTEGEDVEEDEGECVGFDELGRDIKLCDLLLVEPTRLVFGESISEPAVEDTRGCVGVLLPPAPAALLPSAEQACSALDS